MPNKPKTTKDKPRSATKSISPIDRRFCIEYLNNGHNATQAYLKLYPDALYTTAGVEGNKRLKKPSVKQYIDRTIDRIEERCIADRARLTELADDILLNNKEERPDTALRAINEIARLNHLYDKGDDESTGHAKLLQALQINVNVGDHSMTGHTSSSTSQDAQNDSNVVDCHEFSSTCDTK